MAIITSRGFLDAGNVGRLPTKEGGTVNFGNLKREAVMGDDGVLGHTETFEGAPFIKVTLADSTALDKEALENFVGQTILYSTNNGQKFSLADAWVGNVLELNVKEGTLDVEFYGTKLIQK
jgi:hypothetical protein